MNGSAGDGKPSDGRAKPTGRVRRRKWVRLLSVVALLASAAGIYLLAVRDTGPADPAEGEVLVLDPVQINLGGAHYLRLGVALQLTEGATELDGSKALDAAISLFSGRRAETLSNARVRGELKEELADELEEAYDGAVMAVYFTEFVTQ